MRRLELLPQSSSAGIPSKPVWVPLHRVSILLSPQPVSMTTDDGYFRSRFGSAHLSGRSRYRSSDSFTESEPDVSSTRYPSSSRYCDRDRYRSSSAHHRRHHHGHRRHHHGSSYCRYHYGHGDSSFRRMLRRMVRSMRYGSDDYYYRRSSRDRYRHDPQTCPCCRDYRKSRRYRYT